MDRAQIENIYKANGLTDYKLKSLDDLMKVHGIDPRAVKGYNRLDDLNRLLYEKYIVNYFNAQGLESRATILPEAIYFVESKEYSVKENPDDEYSMDAGGLLQAIDKNGLKTVLYDRVYEEYKRMDIIIDESEFYLRFEFEQQGRKTWLHVINENEWY